MAKGRCRVVSERRAKTRGAARVRESEPSRLYIQFLFPRSVLISPLWHIMRMGCARSHDGNVLVEKRECTSAMCDAQSASCRRCWGWCVKGVAGAFG